MNEPVEEVRMAAHLSQESSRCRMFRVRRDMAGFSAGDLLLVVTDAVPEGGEFVIDWHGRLGRHGGGPVRGVVVGVVRGGAAARAAARARPRTAPGRSAGDAATAPRALSSPAEPGASAPRAPPRCPG